MGTLPLLERLSRAGTEIALFEELCAIGLERDGIGLACVATIDPISGATTVVAASGDRAFLERPPGIAVPLPADVEPAAVLRLYAGEVSAETQELAEQLASVGGLIRRLMQNVADRFRLATAGSELSMFTMDRDLRYTWMEAPSLGIRGADIVGRTDAEVLPAGSAERVSELKRRVIAHGETVAAETLIGENHYWLTLEPLRDAAGAITGLAGQATKVTARKLAERELERLAAAAELGMDAITSVDADGRIVHWNRGAERLFGPPSQELAKRLIDNVGAAREQLLAGGDPITYETPSRRPDGTPVDMRVTVLPWRVEGEVVGITAVAVDITDRVRAEREREGAIQQLQDAQQLARIGSWTHSLDDGQTTWSPELYSIYGIESSSGAEAQRRGLDGVHADDRERVEAAFNAMRDGGPQVDIEHRITVADGSERIVRVIARRDPRRPGGFFGTTQDITEQRRALDRVRELDALFTIGFSDSPMGMVLFTELGVVLQANESLARMLGYDASAQLAGLTWRQLVHPDDLHLALGMNQALTSGEQVVIQLRFCTATGDAIHAVSATTALRTGPDQPLTIFSQILDITNRVQVERDLADSEARYRRILETTLEGVWTLDAEDTTTFANPALAAILDCNPAALIGRRLSDFVLGDVDLRSGGRHELELVSTNGRRVWALVAANPMHDATGGYLGALAMVTDITDRKAMETRLQHLADHDHLTGIFNRRRLLEELDEQLRMAARTGRGGAALVIDLDHFKFINDTNGHLAGDNVLRMVSDVLRARLRSTDVVARLGGDEFALVLAQVSAAEAMTVARELRGLLATRDARRPIVASVGVVHFTGSEELTADEILVCADTALYEAKEHGGDQARLFGGQATGALRWVQRIRTALAEDRLVLHAQPILDLRTGAIVRHELLVRMVGEDGELIAPGAFLPTAERFGLIQEVDAWVVRRGLALAATGRAIAVNLSAYSVSQPVIASLARGAALAGLDPANVTFEITETAALTNLDAARQFVESVAGLGFSVALDDFGTGFGSFTYLKHIPARYLKIDMEFVRGLRDSPVDQEVVRSIVGIARSLDKRTVAEGVEDADTLALLRAYGVDYVQGFAIGRPAPFPE